MGLKPHLHTVRDVRAGLCGRGFSPAHQGHWEGYIDVPTAPGLGIELDEAQMVDGSVVDW